MSELRAIRFCFQFALRGNLAPARFVLKRWLKGICTLHCVQCQREKGFNLRTHCYTCQLANIKKALFEEESQP